MALSNRSEFKSPLDSKKEEILSRARAAIEELRVFYQSHPGHLARIEEKINEIERRRGHLVAEGVDVDEQLRANSPSTGFCASIFKDHG